MSDDHFAELQLIDFSRVQREALERWIPILLTAGEIAIAEEIRVDKKTADHIEFVLRAA
jgi:hypothetical protein